MEYNALMLAFRTANKEIFLSEARIPGKYEEDFHELQYLLQELDIGFEEYAFAICRHYEWFVMKKGWKYLYASVFISDKSLDIVVKKIAQGATKRNKIEKMTKDTAAQILADERKLANYYISDAVNGNDTYIDPFTVAKELNLSPHWYNAYKFSKRPIQQVIDDIRAEHKIHTKFKDYASLARHIAHKRTKAYKRELYKHLRPQQ